MFAFLATRGEFTLIAREARREVLTVGRGVASEQGLKPAKVLRLIRPTSDAWGLRRQFLRGISVLGVIGTVISIQIARAYRADVVATLAMLGVVFAVVYSIARIAEPAVWRAIARRRDGPGLELRLESVQYGWLGHRVLVYHEGQPLHLTVYGPRGRFKKALLD